MVRVEKRVAGGESYYYLGHSFRFKGKVRKKELYLGKAVPRDIEAVKKKFMQEIYAEKWFGVFDKIRSGYGRDQAKAPDYVKEKELEAFAIKFTYDTNRIEGSKLSFRDTANLLQRGITPKEKPVRDIKEAESHNKVFREMLEYCKNFSLQIILYWHRRLLENTKAELAGKIRDHQVAISGSRFMPPSPVEVAPLLKEFFRWYERSKTGMNAIQLAALVHLKLVTIHPFGDGNGRISRLAMNFVLHKRKYPMLDIRYEKRTGYYNALERAQVKNDEGIFLNWFFKAYAKENKRHLKGG